MVPALAGSLSRNEALKDDTNDKGAARGSVCRTVVKGTGGGAARALKGAETLYAFSTFFYAFLAYGIFDSRVARLLTGMALQENQISLDIFPPFKPFLAF